MNFFESFKKRLLLALDKDLLGEVSHKKMSPPARKTMGELGVLEKDVKIASVAIHLFAIENEEPQFVLMLRSDYPGTHSAQVSFPGGKRDNSDPDLEYTARRESEEELAIPVTSGELVKKLTPMYIPVSNFLVHPFLILHSEKIPIRINTDEVKEYFFVQLKDLFDNSNISETIINNGKIQFRTPCYNFGEIMVWGATAVILSELQDVLEELFN